MKNDARRGKNKRAPFMAIRDWPRAERPRERLLSEGPATLSDAQLLAILLQTGVKGRTAVDLARQLLSDFGSLKNILHADKQSFCKQPGLGINKFISLQAALEIGRRYLYDTLESQNILCNLKQTKDYITLKLSHHQHEVFACLYLDISYRLIDYEELFHGSINNATIHPREIIKRILHFNAAGVILAHNHPSGHATPSQIDIDMTVHLKSLLSAIDVALIDHIIIGHGKTISFIESGFL